MKHEPAITVASITAGVTALLALLVAFGIPVTDAQSAAILGVAAVVGPLAVGLITRQQVSPAGSAATLAEEAYQDGQDAADEPDSDPLPVHPEIGLTSAGDDSPLPLEDQDGTPVRP